MIRIFNFAEREKYPVAAFDQTADSLCSVSIGSGMTSRFTADIRKIARILARPVKKDRGRGGLVVQPYRGYGSHREIVLMGRVFRQPGIGAFSVKSPSVQDLIDILRRVLRWGVGGAEVFIRFNGANQRVLANKDGYFRVRMRPQHTPPPNREWHPVQIELLKPEAPKARAVGEVFIPPPNSRFVVISDIDDTVVFTGVANKLKMSWRLFMQGYRSRIAFPGVASFYNALHDGLAGNELNPILYVSRGPWVIYEVLEQFFNYHDIPVGPILFLRDWGFSFQNPLPKRSRGHKLALVREMLSLYREMPFVLIGDSGQHDPEIYTRIARENPGRILAVYIRTVTNDNKRIQAMEALAREIHEIGSTLVAASDSFAMAEHAAERGLISSEALSSVLAERIAEGDTGCRKTEIQEAFERNPPLIKRN